MAAPPDGLRSASSPGRTRRGRRGPESGSSTVAAPEAGGSLGQGYSRSVSLTWPPPTNR
jgi:hypothetical protein